MGELGRPNAVGIGGTTRSEKESKFSLRALGIFPSCSLAAAGHRVRIETMIKKVNGLAALERDRHRCQQSRTYGRVCNVRAVYGLHTPRPVQEGGLWAVVVYARVDCGNFWPGAGGAHPPASRWIHTRTCYSTKQRPNGAFAGVSQLKLQSPAANVRG